MLGQFVLILPEIVLTLIALSGQLLAVFYKDCTSRVLSLTVAVLSGFVIWLLFFTPQLYVGFGGSFEVSSTTMLFKAMIGVLTIMSVVVYQNLVKIAGEAVKMEFVTLILLSLVGVFISISARDFILLFCGLELQALAGYALAAFNSGEVKSSEAGLKYFILGALMSCLMLLGISFLYGFSGSFYFRGINIALNSTASIGLVIGVILVLATMLFKLSAAPLHIWAPDVYEGAPISAVTYFAVAQKMGALIVFINFMTLVMGDYYKALVGLIKISAILSIFIGSLGAIMQSSLKRLMAYSSILNIGYVLIGVVSGVGAGTDAALLYMFIYIIGVMVFFTCLTALLGAKSDNASFDDLRGIAGTRKAIAAGIAIVMFSMTGLPPLAGFFGKYYIFYNALKEGEIVLAALGLLTSVISAFYYLKVIKYMYFMEPVEEVTIIHSRSGLLAISVICTGFILFFCVFASSYFG